jgi:thiol-disulfide isomerase/thioredoxin
VTILATRAGVRRGGLVARLAIVTLSVLAGAAIALAGSARAEPSRFIPWKDAVNPPLALTDLGGTTRMLADYRGRVVLVNFWATWCEPCRDELASISRLQERLAGKPFVVLLVNYGEARARVAEFAKREAVAFPILLDPNQDAPKAWRVRVLPSSFLVGADSRVRYSVIGEIDWAENDAVEVVQNLLR